MVSSLSIHLHWNISKKTKTKQKKKVKPPIAPCKVIRNPGNCSLWNPQSSALDFGI